MKRWSIWLLVAAMVVMGLGSTANAETVLKVWAHHHPPRVEKTQALLDEFERLNPDITIEFTTMPYDAYWISFYLPWQRERAQMFCTFMVLGPPNS
ncbi:MAG: hypothetical protein GX354_00900 [Firmicutes bacterium]|nr:hypothetical protein [Bacillota bacterium]